MPNVATFEQELARVEAYLCSFKNDSAIGITTRLLTALTTQGQVDSPFGIRVQLADADAYEQDQRGEQALQKTLRVQQLSQAKEQWEVYARSCLMLALIYEKTGLKARSREQLDQAQASIDCYGLGRVYPYFAIRRSSWERIFNDRKAALFFAREALRTATLYQLVHEQATSHMLLNILLPETAVDERLQHCLAGGRLFGQVGDYPGRCYMFYPICQMYIARNDFGRALAYADSTLLAAHRAEAEGHEHFMGTAYAYKLRSALYERMGKFDSALVNTQRSHALELAFNAAEEQEKIIEVEARYQNERKQKQIEEQRLALRLKNDQLLFSGIIGLLVLMLTVGLFVGYRRQRSAKEHLRTQNALIQQQTAQLEAQDAAKTRLFTNISHEFRTPLTVINGLAAQLGQSTNGNTQEAATLIGRNGENLLHLVNQILDLAQIDHGSMLINWVRGNIITYLQYLTESFYSLAQQREVQLVFYSEQSTVLMDFDAGKLQTILTNLVGNALKFTPRQGKIIIHADVVSGTLAGSQFLKLNVQDTGSGIAEHELPHIFDRFYQADDSSTRRNEGTGIGLALVHELTTLLGGRIVVESRVGRGTTFTLTLPIHQHDPEATLWEPTLALPIKAKPNVPTPATYLPPTATDKPLLLLIEDNADVATYISSLLQRDYQVAWADNGRAGIERAWDIVPDIIISDVMMPEKDGYDVCHTLKTDERSSHIPIILLTAKATQTDKLTGLKTGADAYLEKPFLTDELFVRLNNLVSLRKRLQTKYSQTIRLTAPLPKPGCGDGPPALTLDEQFLAKINTVIADNIDNTNLGIGHLCAATNLSNTQVFRKLKALTGQNPTLYVRRQRLERAVGLLQNPALNVAEVAYAVGFADPNYFSRAFAETFGHPPDALRKRLKTSLV